MEDLNLYHYSSMALAVLVFLFGTGWLSGLIKKNRSKVAVHDQRLIRVHDDTAWGLKFEGRLIKSGDSKDIVKKANTFLYLWEGVSIRSKFSVGLKKINEETGYLLPLAIDPYEPYDIEGFEVIPHYLWNKKIVSIFDRDDLVLRCELKFSHAKLIVFRCNKDGEVKRSKFAFFIKETFAKVNKINI